MKHLKQLQQQLKESLPREGISQVIKSLRAHLPETSPKYNLLLQLESEYRDLKLQTLEGVLSEDKIKLANNQIRKRLLELIDTLEPADFDRQTKRSRFSREQKIRKGHVLYRIPQTMQLWEESRCLVRIAFDKAMLVEDLDLEEDTKVKMDVRISDYMKVEVIDPAAEPTFEIRSTSEAVQFVDEDDFTEWRYYVKPLRPGKHILELKVTIMLVIDGEARVRERTLEESVVIVAEPVTEPAETAFKTLDESLTLPCTIERVAPAASGYRLPKGIRSFALGLIALLLVSSTTWAITPAAERNWIVTRYFENTADAYREYLQEYPESRHAETATFRKAKVSADPDPQAYRAYLEAYPDGQYAEPATWELAELTDDPEAYLVYLEKFPAAPKAPGARQNLQQLETKVWQEVQSRQDLSALDRYLRLYPQGTHREAAGELLEDSAVWKKPLLPDSTAVKPGALQDRLWQQVQTRNSRPALEQFIRQFPESPYREAARRQLEALSKSVSGAEPGAATSPTSTAQQPGATSAGPVKTLEGKPVGEQNKEETPDAATPPTTGRDTAKEQIKTSDPATNKPVGEQKAPATTAEPPPPGNTSVEVPEMVRVKGGTFTMGCLDEKRDGDCYNSEKPPHKVTVSDFSIGKFEVTQQQWRSVMGEDPSSNKGCDQCPVERVSWNDIQEFLRKLNALTGQNFRLPTEAEWEYAARGGQRSQGFLYSGSNNIEEVAWYAVNYEKGNTNGEQRTTRPVGTKMANELGLFDMSGNVWEWCEDVWHENYEGAPTDGAAWISGGDSASRRVLRGGSWYYYSWFTRVAYRLSYFPYFRFINYGFRLAQD